VNTLPPASLSVEVWVAIIAAAASVVAALISGLFTRSNNRALKKLEETQAEAEARISYSYEARKRLYTVCEPLLFQATEQATEARLRISGLAQAARREHLRPDGAGWMSSPDNYFFRSTVYNLLAPLTSFCILQGRLTTIDLGLDTAVRAKYEMLRLIFFSLKNDWDLAGWGDATSKLEYDRNRTDVGEPDRERLLRESPQRHAPQGLYRAMLYVVAEALVVGDDARAAQDGARPAERCITFGEFQREWEGAEPKRTSLVRRPLVLVSRSEQPPSSMEPVFDTLVELMQGFHPRRKPVLWRVLVAHYLLCKALLSEAPELEPLTEEEIADFDWRSPAESGEDFRLSLTVAEGFVGEQLASLRGRLEPR